MGTFKVLSGTTKASAGYFNSPFEKGALTLTSGLFKKQKIHLSSVEVSTEGLQAPNTKTIRFFLRHDGKEWLCDSPISDFASLQSILYQYKHARSTELPSVGPLKKWGTIIGLGVVFGVLTNSCNKPLTPEEEAKKAAQEVEQNAARARLLAISTIQTELEKSLTDPDSVKYTQKAYNLDNNAICFAFRSKNGFGGYVSSTIVVHNRKVTQDNTKIFSKLCPRNGNYENY